jgi:hypothetical protein
MKIQITNNLDNNAKILNLPIFPAKDISHTVITLHWSAGGYNTTFPKEYNFCITGDGFIEKGVDLKKQIPTAKSGSAAHTRNANSDNIGVCILCMKEGDESEAIKGNFGECPPTEEQLHSMILLVATLCKFYKIPVSKNRILGHGEWTTIKGKVQRGKWDLNALPGIAYSKNSDGTYSGPSHIREQVSLVLDGEKPTPNVSEEPEKRVLYRQLYQFANDIQDEFRRQKFLELLNKLRSKLEL